MKKPLKKKEGKKYVTQKVTIMGHDFWYLPGSEESPNGPISPLHHCDEEGNLDIRMIFSSDTYAHCGDDGVVRRYGEEICHIDDLLAPTRK